MGCGAAGCTWHHSKWPPTFIAVARPRGWGWCSSVFLAIFVCQDGRQLALDFTKNWNLSKKCENCNFYLKLQSIMQLNILLLLLVFKMFFSFLPKKDVKHIVYSKVAWPHAAYDVIFCYRSNQLSPNFTKGRHVLTIKSVEKLEKKT